MTTVLYQEKESIFDAEMGDQRGTCVVRRPARRWPVFVFRPYVIKLVVAGRTSPNRHPDGLRDTRCKPGGLNTVVWVPGRERPLRKDFGRAIAADQPPTPTLTSVIDNIFARSHEILAGNSGPAAFDFLLLVPSRQIDHGDELSTLRGPESFGVPNGHPYAAYYLSCFPDGSVGGDGQ